VVVVVVDVDEVLEVLDVLELVDGGAVVGAGGASSSELSASPRAHAETARTRSARTMTPAGAWRARGRSTMEFRPGIAYSLANARRPRAASLARLGHTAAAPDS
jgi:hypothetical protein